MLLINSHYHQISRYIRCKIVTTLSPFPSDFRHRCLSSSCRITATFMILLFSLSPVCRISLPATRPPILATTVQNRHLHCLWPGLTCTYHSCCSLLLPPVLHFPLRMTPLFRSTSYLRCPCQSFTTIKKHIGTPIVRPPAAICPKNILVLHGTHNFIVDV